MIISLHMPKTGGTSFRTLLQNHFATGFMADYTDKPMSKPFDVRTVEADIEQEKIALNKNNLLKFKDVTCVHGHFLPYKYQYFLKNGKNIFVTWLRSPLERFVSHYHYWKRTYREDVPNPFHKKVIEEGWSFEEFCFSEHFQNFYSNYLWNFPARNFHFIGITEHYESDVSFFITNFLKAENLNIPHENENPNKIKPDGLSEDFRRRFRHFHSLDYKIYEQELGKSIERKKAFIRNSL